LMALSNRHQHRALAALRAQFSDLLRLPGSTLTKPYVIGA